MTVRFRVELPRTHWVELTEKQLLALQDEHYLSNCTNSLFSLNLLIFPKYSNFLFKQ